MPDTHYTDLPSRTLTAAQVHCARLRVATASLAEYPDEGDPRAGWDCERLLEMLGLTDASEASLPAPGSTTQGTR